MENVLKNINKKFVSLSDEDIKRNNTILKSALDLITEKMKQKDSLFKEMYTRVFFGGSYYDGLRVGQPDEFDLDLLLTLPKLVEPTITTSNLPGFVHLQFKEYIKFLKQTDLVVRYKGLDKLIDESQYLDTKKVLRWMESVVTLALNEFQKQGNQYILNIPHGTLFAKICKGGPAFTLKVQGRINGKDVSMDVDLVPCFIFGKEKWPVNGFRANPVANKPDYFIVPKPLDSVSNGSRYWRLSFQEQERVIIDSKKNLKPAVKFLKKLRDNMDHKCIASYFIKTVILWQTEQRDVTFWSNSLSYVFINMLKEYYDCLKAEKINYYWNKNNNLLKNIKPVTLSNLSNRIKVIIDDIEKHPENPLLVAKYLCTPSEFNQFEKELSSNIELNLQLSRAKI